MGQLDADALEREGWSLCRTFQKDKDTMVYEVKKPSDFPTIEERKTGKWIRCDTDGFRNMSKCPECGAMIDINEEFRSLFCYHCGLKMIGVQK